MSRSLWPIFLTACLLASNAANGRIWTDASGEQQVKAEFITVQFGKVWLLRSDGRVFGIEMTGLSKADQEFVREQIRKKKAEEDRTTQNPPGCIPYGRGRELCRLTNKEIDESSGLACSRRKPREIIVPERVQGESMCFGPDGKTLYLTSENLPTPLFVVPVLK